MVSGVTAVSLCNRQLVYSCSFGSISSSLFIQELLAELAKLAPKSSALPAAQGPSKPTGVGADSKKPQAHQDGAQHPSQLAGGVSYDVTSEIQPAEEQSVSHDIQPSAASSHSNAQHGPASCYHGTRWVSETCSELAGKAHDFWHGQVRLHAA